MVLKYFFDISVIKRFSWFVVWWVVELLVEVGVVVCM